MKTVDDWTPDSSMFEIRLFKKQKREGRERASARERENATRIKTGRKAGRKKKEKHERSGGNESRNKTIATQLA